MAQLNHQYTVKEINAIIGREKRRITHLKSKIEDIRFDIRATKRAMKMWEAELKRAKKREAKN